MGQVGFGGFIILWPKPNSTHYKFFFFVTQPNPPSPKNRLNLAGWVRFGGSVGFLHTPISSSFFILCFRSHRSLVLLSCWCYLISISLFQSHGFLILWVYDCDTVGLCICLCFSLLWVCDSLGLWLWHCGSLRLLVFLDLISLGFSFRLEITSTTPTTQLMTQATKSDPSIWSETSPLISYSI